MALVCEATAPAVTMNAVGTVHNVGWLDGQTLTQAEVCTSWLDAGDFAAIGLTSADLTEAFAWGFGVVTVFALLGWSVKTVRQVLSSTFKVDD